MIDVLQSNVGGKNTWKPLQTPAGKSADYTCPNGHVGELTDHTIAKDGTVSPSVVCPRGGCGFHDYIRLIGWRQ